MQREPGEIAVVIPAYRPSGELLDLVRALAKTEAGAIVIVDDGSGPEYQDLFCRVAAFPGVQVLRHAVTRGKGAAVKTAINRVLCTLPGTVGVVTAEVGHHPDDIRRVAAALGAQPAFLILGCRSLDGEPPMRRLGNDLTSSAMHALLGQKLSDAHPGLRGIPKSFLATVLRIDASGPEFELEMLIAAHRLSVPVMEVQIRGTKARMPVAPFNPILDSMKIYFALLRFGSVALLSALLDNVAFYLVYRRFGNILAAQVLARVVSVAFNYSMVRKSVFHSDQRHKTLLPKYLLLVIFSGTASYGGIRFLHETLGLNPSVAKLPIEGIMFLVNFAVQRMFIFKPRTASHRQPATARVLLPSALIAMVFVALLGVEIYGFRTNRLFVPDIWFPIGLARFIRYGGIFLALTVPFLVLVPWAFASFVIVMLVLLTAVSVGPQPLAAVVLFLISSSAMGSRLLGRDKSESITTDLCATLLGSGVYLFLMTLIARAPVNYPVAWGVLLAIPIAIDIRGVWRRLKVWASRLLSIELRSPWERLSLAVLLFILIAQWFVTLKPETSADGLAMHLAIPMNIAANHRMTFEPSRYVWAVMPMGADWLYSIVFLLGGEYASRILNLIMFLGIVALLYSGMRRWISPAAAFLLAASFAATPVVQFVTGALFVENFLVALIVGVMTAYWRFAETGAKRYLYLAMALGGTAIATKYGALLFVLLAMPFLIREIVRHWKALGPRPMAVCVFALLLLVMTASPTYAIAYEKTGNPIFPFLNQKIHSPLLNSSVVIADYRFTMPVTWRTLYALTFHTTQAYEGQDGSFGFQYMIVAPLVFLGLLVLRWSPAGSAAILALGGGLLVMQSTPNVRYLYTSMPLILIAFGALLGWTASNQRWLYRLLIAYIFVCTALNTYFMPASNFYHKEFCLHYPFSLAAKDDYLDEAAPVRKVVRYYNRTHPDSAVLLTSSTAIAGIQGDVYLNNWHQYPIFEQLGAAANASELLRLLGRWKIEYFIVEKLPPGDPTVPPVLQALLDACTATEYTLHGVSLSHLTPECDPRKVLVPH